MEVRAPLKCPRSEIDGFVASKEKWIRDKLALSQRRTERKEAFALSYGGSITLRGGLYPLEARAGKRAGFDGSSFYLPYGLEPEQIKDIVVKIYRRLAKLHLTGRVALYSGRMEVTASAVKVTAAKTRWGSCSSLGSINFSWRLIMADDEVIDYVVVHELAHIKEMNHSANFWKIVEGVLPDYRERKERLRRLQSRLAAENWE